MNSNALLNKVNAANLVRLRATSKALKTVINSRKDLTNKIKTLKRKQEQAKSALTRLRTGSLKTGKIASKYFGHYGGRPQGMNWKEMAHFRLPAGQFVSVPRNQTRALNNYRNLNRIKKMKKTEIMKWDDGKIIYFEPLNKPWGLVYEFNPRQMKLNLYTGNGDGVYKEYQKVKKSNIFSKSNRRKIKSLHE